MDSSRRDLSNDMAEHRPILKNNQNTHHPRFSFTPKTYSIPKRVFCFYSVDNKTFEIESARLYLHSKLIKMHVEPYPLLFRIITLHLGS